MLCQNSRMRVKPLLDLIIKRHRIYRALRGEKVFKLRKRELCQAIKGEIPIKFMLCKEQMLYVAVFVKRIHLKIPI